MQNLCEINFGTIEMVLIANVIMASRFRICINFDTSIFKTF